ncbi:Spore germination protein B1 [compost metagenome]
MKKWGYSGFGRTSSGAGGSLERSHPVRMISADLEQTLTAIMSELGNSEDVKIRRLSVGIRPAVAVAVVRLSTLADSVTINDFVIGSLLKFDRIIPEEYGEKPEGLQNMMLERMLESGEATVKDDWNDMILSLLSGDTAVLLNGCASSIICDTRSSEGRAIEAPATQLVVRGPRDSFVESVGTNVMLIRRRVKSPNLWMERLTVGEVTKTDIALLYMKGTCDDKLLDEVKARIGKIKTDSILESGYIEEWIQDKTLTPFPTIYNTERPDTVAANLLEGRVVVVVDGSPFVLILPAVFSQFFESPADYSQRFEIVIVMRLIRYLSYIILLFGPSIFVALTTFHYDMIPTTLLISLLAQRENVPFPALAEALLMIAAFEIMQEAGIRMPRAVGQTVSVVGGLVVGQAAVEAGIVTPAMVIVVALTGIAVFAIPAYNMAIAGRIISQGFLLIGGMFGFYGITLGLIVLAAHLNSLRSFGMPYLTPVVPLSINGLRESLLRIPSSLSRSGSVSMGSSADRSNPGSDKDSSAPEADQSTTIRVKDSEANRRSRGAAKKGGQQDGHL